MTLSESNRRNTPVQFQPSRHPLRAKSQVGMLSARGSRWGTGTPVWSAVNQRLMRARATVGALIALGAMVAGCGGGGSNLGVATVSTSGSRSSSASTHDQALAFAMCVRTHGVPLWPDPDGSGRFEKSKLTPSQLGVSMAKAGAAQHACKALLPTYSPSEQPQDLAQALRFSRCMRAHGSANFPDPESNGAIRIPHAIENSPAYLAALNFCIHKYGVPPPPPAGGGHS